MAQLRKLKVAGSPDTVPAQQVFKGGRAKRHFLFVIVLCHEIANVSLDCQSESESINSKGAELNCSKSPQFNIQSL